MNICLANFKPKTGDKKKNIKKMEKLVTNESADMFVFGEMSLTGYMCRDEIFSLAEQKNGESLETIKGIARDNNCAIIFGMPIESRPGIIHNSAVLAQPDKVDVYDKNFLANFGPFEERFFFSPGTHMPVFDTPYGKIGLCICFDLFFPEFLKGMVLKGADLIVCISASPSTTRIYFEQVLPARAIENTVFMAYSNLVGEQQGLTFWGGGQSYTPKGELLGKADYFKEHHIVQELDFSLLREARIGRPTIKETRADFFLELYDAAVKKPVFNKDVKTGMILGEKIANIKGINEVDLYGTNDVAFGLSLTCKCSSINVINELKDIRVITKGKDHIEIRPDDE